MKRFILFLVVALMLLMVPMFAGAMAPGQSGGWTPDLSDMIFAQSLDIGGEVIIFEDQGIDIRVASAESCGSCHSSTIVRSTSHDPGHPSPALVSIGKRLIQRRILSVGNLRIYNC